ncbi:unnamed protein product, partial [Mesorhabditis spiculigera]
MAHTPMKSLVALATEKLLLKTSGNTFLEGVAFMYSAGLSPDRVSVMRTQEDKKYILMFHSKCDIRPFAANYASFDRVLRGLVHIRAWHLKSIEFVDIDFRSKDMPHLERTIDKLGVDLVVLRNCTYHGIQPGEESQKLLNALNRKKQAVVCEYGDTRLKHRLCRRPTAPAPDVPALGQQNVPDDDAVSMMAPAAPRPQNHRARRVSGRSRMDLHESLDVVVQHLKSNIQWILLPAGLYAISKLAQKLVPGPHNQPRLSFRDKTVLITGASTGLGRALATELYARGAKLILTARSIDKLRELAEELKASGVQNKHEPAYRSGKTGRAVDRREDDRCPHQQRRSLESRPDYRHADQDSATNYGSMPFYLLFNILLQVNYFGHITVTKALLPFIPDEGCIIVTSSLQGRVAVPYRSAYSASKHALQGFFDSMRGEERHNLQILIVSAGYMNTGFGAKALDINGQPVAKEDQDQAKGYSSEYSAKAILDSAERRDIELILAPFVHRTGIFLRWLWPTLFYRLMYKRSLKDEYGKKQQ